MAFTFTDANVRDIIASGKPVVIDFWATWCGPCMAMSPVVERLAEEFADRDIVIGKYNTDEEAEFCTENRVMSIPCFLFFKNGQAVPSLRMAGAQKEDVLRARIEELLAM